MIKYFRILSFVWGFITLAAMPVLGTWSTWYPWPPEANVINDFQNAVWLTWFWLGVVPTILFIAAYYLWPEEN